MKIKLLLPLLLTSNAIFANITLPSFFSDNMVLQRNATIKIWGWANPNEAIELQTGWDNKTYTVKTGNQATWELLVATPQAGGPYDITLKGYNAVSIKNVLIGEVWLCSGQSNMEMAASWGIKDGEEEVKKANFPNIRLLLIQKSTALTPQNNVRVEWTECTPETMKNFSAAAYFFARRLQEELKGIPIGLIESAWGGTPAEVWIPETAVQSDPIVMEAASKLQSFEWGPREPGRAFNSMIAPVVGFKIAGVIWYQGESNVGSRIYEQTFATLITSWRNLWAADFPFYFVQIAPYTDAGAYDGAIIRDAQRRTLQLPKTAMVVTSDISTPDDIHPKDKKTVGIRLANLALANIYKTNSNLVNGPLFQKIQADKNTVTVFFDHADGLFFKDKNNKQFEVAGTNGEFFPAIATIKNNTIVLKSAHVKQPTKVRFAWKSGIQSALFNKAGLPASSFITE